MPTKLTAIDLNTLQVKIIDDLLMSDELDQLFLSLNKLLDMNEEGEIELLLDQPNKSTKQKQLYIRKIIGVLYYPKLQLVLDEILGSENLDFFSKKYFPDWLNTLQTMAEKCYVLRLTVATNFKEKELREMAEYMTKKLERKVVLHLKVDSSLIGGAIIQHGNYITDYSLKTKLALFRSHWQKAAQ